MTSASRSQDLEDQFAAAFQALLNRAVEHVSGRVGRLLAAGLVDEAPFRSFRQMAEWSETKHSLALALRSSALKRLTWDAGGKSIRTPSFWVNWTLFPAVKRYCAFASPFSGAPRVRGHARRIARVTNEVIRWAKLDPVPLITTTLVYGLRTEGKRRFKVTPDTVMRVATLEEWEPLLRAQGITFQPLCLETRSELPRLQSPTLQVPKLFIQALELVLDHAVAMGETTVRPTVPTFSISNQEHGVLRPVPSTLHRAPRLVTAKDIRTARRVTAAFRNLHETGFDLALDLWASSLHRNNPRERAVDIAIALENLYLVESHELRYRFQLHVAVFGRRLPRSARVDMKKAKELYDARSSAVHGDRPSAQKIRLLNTDGARLVRSTLLSIVPHRNRSFLQNIKGEVTRLVEP